MHKTGLKSVQLNKEGFDDISEKLEVLGKDWRSVYM